MRGLAKYDFGDSDAVDVDAAVIGVNNACGDGRDKGWERGELRTASRTGSKAGIAEAAERRRCYSKSRGCQVIRDGNVE